MTAYADARDALRVALICPYSLSVDGGVQLQVRGLARALRGVGVDARVLGPSDGPPPEAGITSLGPTRGFPSNGSIAPITAGKAVVGRTLEAHEGTALLRTVERVRALAKTARAGDTTVFETLTGELSAMPVESYQ